MLAVEGGHASLELGAIVRMGEVPLSPLEVIPVLHVRHNPVDGGGPGQFQCLVTFLEILDVTSPPLLDHIAKGALDHLGQVHEVGPEALEALGEQVLEQAGPVQPHIALIPLNLLVRIL